MTINDIYILAAQGICGFTVIMAVSFYAFIFFVNRGKSHE